jgi:hypothetical protein
MQRAGLHLNQSRLVPWLSPKRRYLFAWAVRCQETSWWYPSRCTEFCGTYLPRTEALRSGLEAREYCKLDCGNSSYISN